MRQRRSASQKTTIHRHAPTARCITKTAEERFHMLARGWLAYPVTPMHTQLPPKCGCRERLRRGKTAEERFNMLARGWLAYPVTPMHAHLPPKSGCRNTIATYIVAERRHFSVTRYAERSGCVPGFCASFKSRVPEVRHYLWRDG